LKERSYHINDELLVKHLLGESSAGENAAVEKWVDADSSNKKYYEDFKLIWEESKHLASTSNIDGEASWQRFRYRIHSTSARRSKVKPINTFYWAKIAAILIIIAGTAVFAYTIFNNKKAQTFAIQSQNKIVTDTLPDGSIITLNKNSVLSYPEKFGGDTRSIDLRGEAFFKVTPDKKKPFIIHVNDVTVKVVGTSFNVKNSKSIEVIVESGIVQVMKKNERVELHPGERILIKKEDSVLTKEIQKETLYNYYRTKQFECDNTPLWKLVDVLNQAYDANIIIKNKALDNLPLTATFNNESLDNILAIIRQTFKISIVKSGDQIILK
jgi:ferric-dicitrate binding protein FerR (iron transport regulator)